MRTATYRLPTQRLPTHPGEMLLEEFLKPLGISQLGFSKHLNIPLQRLNEIVLGKRGVSPETAWLLGMALGTGPEIWLDLQAAYDLATHKPERKIRILSQLKAAV
ncbi:MAG TPA: HigA family addiction module antitoxin [Planctomycetota bacterium]|nr:HigA family addiction module antitoxin [Planctomycetota bacterium]